MTEISIVVPTYNEEENIKPFLQRTEKVLDKLGKSYEIIFALDPSSDNTEKIILDEIKRNKNIKNLKNNNSQISHSFLYRVALFYELQLLFY